jgi:hypothetical protein
MELNSNLLTCSLDGVPIYKSGEWIGSKPSHWNTSKKILKPIEKRNDINRGIRTYKLENKSAELREIQYRPAFKILSEKLSSTHQENTPKRGKRLIKPNYTDPKTYPLKLLNKNIVIKPQEIRLKKQFQIPISAETEVEKFTGQKIRLPTLDARRNYINLNSPGDKIYKNVEYSPGFFKNGGLIVGSTNVIKYKQSSGKKSDNFYDSLDLNKKTLDPEKLWKNREVKESLEFDSNYVSNLKVWEEDILKSYLPPKVKNDNIDIRNNSPKKK